MDPAAESKHRDAKKPHDRRMKLIAAFKGASKKDVTSIEGVSPAVSEAVGRVSFANSLEPASLSQALGGGSYPAGPRVKREGQKDETLNAPTAETRIAGSSIEFIAATGNDKGGPLN
jgi:hypothetical protein